MEKKSNGKLFKILLLNILIIVVGFQIFLLYIGSRPSATGQTTDVFQNIFGSGISGLIRHSGVAATGDTAPYSKLSLNEEGYRTALEWDKQYNLPPERQKEYAGFDTLIPCCGFQKTTDNENNDCRCGHHIAMAGIIKKLLLDGVSRDKIQQELNAWKPIFYPECKQNPKLCDL